MTPDEISIRPFTWQDLAILGAFKPAPGGHDAGATALERWLRQPNLLPERDCLLVYTASTLVGYSYVVLEQALSRAVLVTDVLQGGDAAAIERRLLDACIVHARELGLAAVQVDVPDGDAGRRRLLQSTGFQHVRTHHHLRASGSATVGAQPREGQTLRVAGREDVAALTALQNAAFEGSWGYSPNTPEEIEYRVFVLPTHPPDGVVLLHQDGALAAYCWTEREEGGAPGIVSMVGVLPGMQGKGLGRLVTAAGLDHLIDEGAVPIDITVDAENTPAIRLYEGLGFVRQWQSLWFELRLS